MLRYQDFLNPKLPPRALLMQKPCNSTAEIYM